MLQIAIVAVTSAFVFGFVLCDERAIAATTWSRPFTRVGSVPICITV
jgi:hypothetical protein